MNDLRVVSLNSIKVSVVWGFYDTHWLSLKQIGVEVSSKLFPAVGFRSICEKRNVTKSRNRERLFFLVTSFTELREHFWFWNIKTNLTIHSDVPEVIKQ